MRLFAFFTIFGFVLLCGCHNDQVVAPDFGSLRFSFHKIDKSILDDWHRANARPGSMRFSIKRRGAEKCVPENEISLLQLDEQTYRSDALKLEVGEYQILGFAVIQCNTNMVIAFSAPLGWHPSVIVSANET